MTGSRSTGKHHGAREVVVVRMADVEPKAIEWLWPDRIALGKVTMLVGDPGLGKSLVSIAMTAVLTLGGQWPDGTRAPDGEVLIISAEDDIEDTLRPRLDAAGADVERVHGFRMVRRMDPSTGEVQHFGLSLKRDLATLDALLAKNPMCRMVVIDPISAFLDGVNSHKNAEVRGILAPLSELAARYRTAFVLVSHLNKGRGPAIYRAIDSIAFVATVRAAYVVVKDKDDDGRRLFLRIKNNLGPDQSQSGLAYRIETGTNGAPVLAWEKEPVHINVDEALANAPRKRDGASSTLDNAADWLCTMLATAPMKVSDLMAEATAAGYSWRTIRRAQEKLAVSAERVGGIGERGVWMWRFK